MSGRFDRLLLLLVFPWSSCVFFARSRLVGLWVGQSYSTLPSVRPIVPSVPLHFIVHLIPVAFPTCILSSISFPAPPFILPSYASLAPFILRRSSTFILRRSSTVLLFLYTYRRIFPFTSPLLRPLHFIPHGFATPIRFLTVHFFHNGHAHALLHLPPSAPHTTSFTPFPTHHSSYTLRWSVTQACTVLHHCISPIHFSAYNLAFLRPFHLILCLIPMASLLDTFISFPPLHSFVLTHTNRPSLPSPPTEPSNTTNAPPNWATNAQRSASARRLPCPQDRGAC